MGEVLSTLFSTFTTCACGASAHNCAIAQMQQLADLYPNPNSNPTPDPDPELLPHERQQHLTSHERQHDEDQQTTPDLGPLIGATRGLRTTERGQGGREGVDLLPVSGPSVDSVARAFRGVDVDEKATPSKRVHFPAPPPDLVVSAATPSPRKTWERRYSASRPSDSSEDEDIVEDGEDGAARLPLQPPRKKARTMPRIDSSPPAVEVQDDKGLQEETLPPKMRKNWIKETLRVLNEEDAEPPRGHEGKANEMDIDGSGEDVDGEFS
jgi:hypothetical protein